MHDYNQTNKNKRASEDRRWADLEPWAIILVEPQNALSAVVLPPLNRPALLVLETKGIVIDGLE